jgi:epoxyqueuosine reductase
MVGLKGRLIDKAKGMDVPMIGFATVERWKAIGYTPGMPKEFHPDRVYPGTRSVVVLGLPVTLPVIETAPSVQYHELYHTLNDMLDAAAYRMTLMLNDAGHSSVAVSRDGYAGMEALHRNPFAMFSHRHAAYLAGLGTFGVNNSLLTRRYGPRVRFVSVLTEAEIEPDPIIEEELCVRCMRCVKACPVRAISGTDYPGGLMDKSSCTVYNDGLSRRGTSPCGWCIKVCPVGSDRGVHHREDMTIYEGTGELQRSWSHSREHGSR